VLFRSTIEVLRVRVIKNSPRYVLIRPCWILLRAFVIFNWGAEIAFGAIFSNQARSIAWLAMVCPRVKLSWGTKR